MKMRSWVAIACRSHERTPKKASGVSSVGSSSTSSEPSLLRRACQSRMRGGKRNCFHECGPTAYPKRASSLAALEPVGAAVLPVGPAYGQLRPGLELRVHDRPVAHRRPENEVAAPPQDADQGVHRLGLDDSSSQLVHAASTVVRLARPPEPTTRATPDPACGFSAVRMRAGPWVLRANAGGRPAYKTAAKASPNSSRGPTRHSRIVEVKTAPCGAAAPIGTAWTPS